MGETVKSHVTEKVVQSVERTLRIMEFMASRGSPMSLGEISSNLDLKLSTAHRLLKTLILKGFAEQDITTGKYKLGIKTFLIGNTALYNLDIRAVARPFLEKLVETFNETANLAVLDQLDVIYIDQIESQKMVKMLARLGSKIPAYTNAVGKVLLAGLSSSELTTYFKNNQFQLLTKKTVISFEQFKKELETIKKQGYALDLEETDEGITCAASAIYNHMGRVIAALGVSGPSHRMRIYFEKKDLINSLKEAANGISFKLGYQSFSR